MTLDARGDISAFIVAIYVPILVVCFMVAFRHGFSRRAGWVLLVVVSLVRIVGGYLHIAAEEVRPPNISLFIGYSILEAAGLSPLLIATVGFLKTIGEGGFDSNRRLAPSLRFMGLIGIIGFALTVAGGSQASASNPNAGSSLRHAGVILYLVLYVLIVAVQIYYWMNSDLLLRHRRSLLTGISFALPFLAVRVAYSILSGFAPQSYGGQHTTTNSLSKFNSSGPFGYWLGMSVLMELATVIIYITTGLLTPLADDYTAGGIAVESASDEEMLSRGRWHR